MKSGKGLKKIGGMNMGTQQPMMPSPNVGSRANNAKEMGKKALDTIKKNNLLMIILFGIVIGVLVYLILLFNRPSLLYYTLAGIPIKANSKDLAPVKNTDKLPGLKNGREYAYSFWLYLDDIDNSNQYKLVFLRGDNLVDANPLVYFDKDSNKLKVKVKTSLSKGTTFSSDADGSTTAESPNLDSYIVFPNNDNSSNQNKTLNEDTCAYATFEIDYVPLQRWVNVVVNVDNYVITLFMDGAIHSTRLLNDDRNCANNDSVENKSKIVEVTSGNIQVGNYSDADLPAFNGYISKLQFFNYSLKTQAHITKIYENGPVQSKSILQKLGLPLYAFRNPVYRVDRIKTDESESA